MNDKLSKLSLQSQLNLQGLNVSSSFTVYVVEQLLGGRKVSEFATYLSQERT